MSGDVVAVLYADRGSATTDEQPTALPWAGTLELLARHAARCLEAATAAKAIRVLAGHPQSPPDFSPEDSPAAGHEFSSDEDEAPRRYARLLVSEIKLYHAAAVAAGRRERNLSGVWAPKRARHAGSTNNGFHRRAAATSTTFTTSWCGRSLTATRPCSVNPLKTQK
jgi:hypothetical protein